MAQAASTGGLGRSQVIHGINIARFCFGPAFAPSLRKMSPVRQRRIDECLKALSSSERHRCGRCGAEALGEICAKTIKHRYFDM